MKTDLFQSCGHCWVFQICWHIECSTLTASSFRICTSSAGIPSPPLALFIVMFPEAQLSSHSRMSGSRWVPLPSWFSRSLKPYLYSSVYLCCFFLISPAAFRATFSVLYCDNPCIKGSLDISSFLEEFSSVSHSVVFHISLHCSLKKAFISPWYSLELCIQLGVSFPFSLAFHFYSFLSYL